MRVRRTVVGIGLVLLALVASGCFQVEQYVDLRDGDGARLTAVLRVDKAYSGAEMDLFLNALHLAIPAIEQTADYSRREEPGGTGTWIVYEWASQEKRPLEGLPFALVENGDGTFSFDWSIPPMHGFSDQTDSDSILMVIRVSLPRPVDFANTMHVDGHSVRWELRKSDLARGVRLRAFTQ